MCLFSSDLKKNGVPILQTFVDGYVIKDMRTNDKPRKLD